jgi:hypothetical protein
MDLTHTAVLPLHAHADSNLVGVSADYTIYVDILDDDVIHRAFGLDGTPAATIHPRADLVQPHMGHSNHWLNFRGPRHRGLREAERLSDMLRPFPVPTRMALSEHLGIMPLGLAESTILSEAALPTTNLTVVCRRLRIAYALPTVQLDSDNEPYDYDTVTLHVAQVVTPGQDDLLSSLPGLDTPMDCVVRDPYLFVLDTALPGAVHIWMLNHGP